MWSTSNEAKGLQGAPPKVRNRMRVALLLGGRPGGAYLAGIGFVGQRRRTCSESRYSMPHEVPHAYGSDQLPVELDRDGALVLGGDSVAVLPDSPPASLMRWSPIRHTDWSSTGTPGTAPPGSRSPCRTWTCRR